MIVTRTPLRVSFVGGGTDMPAFYQRHPGEVISTAINKYIYIFLNPKFDGRIRVSYSRTENVDDWADIQHDIVRETLKLFQIKGVEVVSVSDIPGEGSGLGSSSAFTVGLLRAIHARIDFNPSNKVLAETAFRIEREICRHPVGKQDHYAAVYGGFRHYIFKKDDVCIRNFGLLDEELSMIGDQMMLLWTGITRGSGGILDEQEKAFDTQGHIFEQGLLMTELVHELAEEIANRSFDKLGRCVNVGWQLKKKFAKEITHNWFESRFTLLRLAGATGHKLCGAGGGGFILVIAPPEKHKDILANHAFSSMPPLPFKIGAPGTSVIYRSEE